MIDPLRTHGGDDAGDDIGVLAGVEGQFYFDDVTLYAQAGWGDIMMDSDPHEGFDNGLFARGVVRYFFCENFLLQGEIAYGWIDEVYRRQRDGGDEAESVYENALLIGLDFAFGAPSLFDNDRRGATLDTPILPVRAAAWAQSVD